MLLPTYTCSQNSIFIYSFLQKKSLALKFFEYSDSLRSVTLCATSIFYVCIKSKQFKRQLIFSFSFMILC